MLAAAATAAASKAAFGSALRISASRSATLTAAHCARNGAISPAASPSLLRTYASNRDNKPPTAHTPPSSSPGDKAQPARDDPASAAAPDAASDPAKEASARRSTSAFDIDTTLLAIADDAADGKGGKERTGARARSDARQSTIEKQRKTTRRLLAAIGLAGLTFTVFDWAKPWSSVKERQRFEGNPLGDSAFGRLRLRTQAMWEDWNAPKWEKLLPDPLPFPYARPYTLVVDLDELLIHSHWTREHGWRTAKRPGLDYFLGYLSQWYEIVLYTTQPYYIAGPIIEKLDPDRRFITYTLFRESCRTHEGKVVKDLSALNRDLSKVVILDVDADKFALHPENGIIAKKWDGRRDDRELMGLVDFFEAIGIYAIPDVRQTIKSYGSTNVAQEHARRMQATKQQRIAEWEASGGNKQKLGVKSWIGNIKGGDSSSSSAGSGPPKTWYDTERERFQQGYAEDVRFWKENGEAIRQQAKEDQERQMKEMKLNAWSMLTGAGMRPPEQQQQQQ